MLQRLENWPQRLHELIETRRRQPFVWGENDCCIFALEHGVRAVTGILLLPEVPRPRTAIAAGRFLLRRGYRDVFSLATELLGQPVPFPRMAGRGDVVGLESPGVKALGVCVGAACATPGSHGLLFVPRSFVVRAWRL